MRSRTTFGYSLLFFLSGTTGLVYQLLWVRVLYQSFGSTIQSVTTVVAAYMGGLGLGAWLLGRFADRHPRPAALYGWLEVAIGVFGVLSPAVLAFTHGAWIAIAGTLDLGPTASIAVRFGLAALVLGIPTTLMGGTLPVLTRALTGGAREALQPQLGKLYGLNTLGAVLGAAVAGFVLIEHVGIRASLWLTALANIALGAIAVVLARPLVPAPAVQPDAPVATPGVVTPAAPALRATAFVLLTVTAFAGLLDEIAWTRVLVMVIGGSTYAFTLVLVVFLLGIGIGSALVARRSHPPPETAATASAAQGISAAGAAVLLVFLGVLPRYIVAVFHIPGLEATGRLVLFGVAIGAVVLIPAVGMGMTFPLLTDLAARRDAARATDVGRAYALNTAGSIMGAALTGFVLVVWLGSDFTLRIGVVLSAGAALLLAVLAARGVPEASDAHRRLRWRVLCGGILGVAALAAAFATPRWDNRLIDLGPTIYGRNVEPGDQLATFLSHRGGRQMTFREGRNATVSVWESQIGRTLKINGKADASDHGDMDTQVMLGLAPVAARAGASSALVIGFGSGVTARVLSDTPGMRTVRIVELEPAVLAIDTLFRRVNADVLSRPGVQAVSDDARSALQLQADQFDVIISEPSNPWVAGVATLYTPEFFRIVRSRLAPDGVFCQWVQLYQLPLPVVAGIAHNLRSVFPHVEVWFGSPNDVLILGSGQPFVYDRAWIERILERGTPLGDFAWSWLGLDAPAEHFGRYLFGSAGVDALVGGSRIEHTDDHPRLEFVAARRFLDAGGSGRLFDSLVLMRPAGDARGAGDALLLAKVLSTRPSDPAAVPYIEAAFQSRPHDPAWALRAAQARAARGDTAGAERALATIPDVRKMPGAALLAGLVAAKRGEATRARSLLRSVLAGGGDTAQAAAGLAALDAREKRWIEAAAHARMALGAVRSTLRYPFPRDFMVEALTQITLEGPVDTAVGLVAATLRHVPGWARLYELEGVAALRSGRCDAGVESFVTLVEFGVHRPDVPELVARCRQGRLGQ